MRMPALTLLAAALCALALPAAAQSQCANLTIVAPFPAGSNTDAVARLVGERVGEALRRPVIIDNKPGAEGQIAAVEVRRAPPDGCRILFATAGNISILPFIRREPPYDPLRDFTPIADIGRYNFFLFVSTAMPADVRGFVEAARARAGVFIYE
jgi:tripartite-type tricarboxylate transporter receptor subunit TctC